MKASYWKLHKSQCTPMGTTVFFMPVCFGGCIDQHYSPISCFFSWPFAVPAKHEFVCFPAKQGLACSSWRHAQTLQERGIVCPGGCPPHAGQGLVILFRVGRGQDSPQGSHGALEKREWWFPRVLAGSQSASLMCPSVDMWPAKSATKKGFLSRRHVCRGQSWSQQGFLPGLPSQQPWAWCSSERGWILWLGCRRYQDMALQGRTTQNSQNEWKEIGSDSKR